MLKYFVQFQVFDNMIHFNYILGTGEQSDNTVVYKIG